MIRNCIITALTVSLLLVTAFAYALFTGLIVHTGGLSAAQVASAQSLAEWDGQ